MRSARFNWTHRTLLRVCVAAAAVVAVFAVPVRAQDECGGVHCGNIESGVSEGWYPDGVDRKATTAAGTLQQTFSDFGESHLNFNTEAAQEVIVSLPPDRRINRYTMGEAIAGGMGLPWDSADLSGSLERLADLGITRGYDNQPGIDLADFGGDDGMTNEQMASFLNRIKNYFSSPSYVPTYTPVTAEAACAGYWTGSKPARYADGTLAPGYIDNPNRASHTAWLHKYCVKPH